MIPRAGRTPARTPKGQAGCGQTSSGRRADANGTMLRLRALHVMGHGSARIARAIGVSEQIIQRIVRGDTKTVSQPLRDAVARIYDCWWNKSAPQQTRAERAAANAARRRAQCGHWCAGAALDDAHLDQPGYQPRDGWRPAAGTGIADDHPFAERKAAVMSIRQTGRAPEPETENVPEPTVLTWAHAHLREQIQRAGAGLAPAACAEDSPTREENRSPLEDMEAEP